MPALATTAVGALGGVGTGGAGGVGFAAITIVNVDVDVVPDEFVAVTVNVYVPAAVGVPVKAPVPGSRLSPGGSVPAPTPNEIELGGELDAAKV